MTTGMSGAFHLFFSPQWCNEFFLTGNGMDGYTERRSWESQGGEIIARRTAGGIYDWTGGESPPVCTPVSLFFSLSLSLFFLCATAQLQDNCLIACTYDYNNRHIHV